MRINIDIDDKLMEQAIKAFRKPSKKATGDEELKSPATLDSQQKIRSFRGKLKWEGDLDQMRNDS